MHCARGLKLKNDSACNIYTVSLRKYAPMHYIRRKFDKKIIYITHCNYTLFLFLIKLLEKAMITVQLFSIEIIFAARICCKIKKKASKLNFYDSST